MMIFVRPALALVNILSIYMNTPVVLPSDRTAATAVPITGWLTDPNYPETVASNDGLLVDRAGTVIGLVQINFNSINHNRGMQLTMNGSVVGSDYLSTNRTDFMVKYYNPDAANKFHQILVHADAGQTANRTLNYGKMIFVPDGTIGESGRMEKDSTEYVAPSGSTWGAPTGFVASSGYGKTVIHNNSIISVGTRNYNINAQATFAISSTGTAVRILVNGSIVATSPSGGVSQSVSINNITINPGDAVSMEVNNNGGSSSRILQPGSSYLEIIESSDLPSLGMQMSSNQTITTFNTDVILQNMVPNALYSNTVIQNNEMLVSSAGSVNIRGNVNWNYDYGIHRVKVFRKRAAVSTVIFDSGVQTYPGGLKSVPFNFNTTVEANDTFYMTMNVDQNFAGSGIVTSGSYITLQYL